jgi:hypothetical protein
MVIFNRQTAQLEFSIPAHSEDDLLKYRRALLKMLSQIEIGGCTDEFRKDLLTIYKFLDHFSIGYSQDAC